MLRSACLLAFSVGLPLGIAGCGSDDDEGDVGQPNTGGTQFITGGSANRGGSLASGKTTIVRLPIKLCRYSASIIGTM